MENVETPRRVGRPRGVTREVIELRNDLRRIQDLDNGSRNKVRRSERIGQKRQVIFVGEYKVLINYDEARRSKDWSKWEQAMREELDSFNKYSAWEMVIKASERGVIKSK